MALKLGKDKEQVKKLVAEKKAMLEKGNTADNYLEMMMNITPESLNVTKDNKDALNKMAEQGKDKIVELPLSDLSESPKNTYSKPTGEKKEEMLASLKAYGQINPIFVRPKSSVENYKDLIENKFEILVGHTRVAFLKELGQTTVKAIIVNCNDVEATLLIAQSNIQREKVTDIEQARAFRNTYEAMKKDKTANLKNVEISTDVSKCQSDTSTKDSADNGGTPTRTDEQVAAKYGLSARTLIRKMALAYCTDKIVELYEKKKINQEQIQNIAKLPPEIQDDLGLKIEKENFKLNNKVAKAMQSEYKEQGTVDLEKVMKENKKETRNIETPKVPDGIKIPQRETYAIPDELFPKGMRKEEKEEYLKAALKYIKENNIAI